MASSFDSFGIDGAEEIHTSSNHRSFEEDDAEIYSNFTTGGSARDVFVDHVSTSSLDVFGFRSSPFDSNHSPYSHSPFSAIHADNGNRNAYNGTGDHDDNNNVFVSDGPIPPPPPPPTELQPEEGFTFLERQQAVR